MSNSPDRARTSASLPGDQALRRQLGLFQLSLAGIGIILGAGIYVLLGEASAEAQGFAWLSFLLAALVTIFTGLSYAELSAMSPRAGAGFEYVRQGFNIHAAFVTGWLTLAAEIVAAAAVALGFGGYLEDLVGLDAGLGALILLGGGTFVAASGALGSFVVAGMLTGVEIGGLLLVSAIGLVDFDAANVTAGGGIMTTLQGSALVFFAYIGFEDLATFSEEAKRPERTLPLAILISIGVTTALYVLVAIASIGAVGAEALAGSQAPLGAVAAIVLGDLAGDVLNVIALAATGNTALLLLMASCRRLYGMAAAGAFPRRFAVVGEGTHVPIQGLLLVAAIAAVFTLWGDIGAVANMTNFALFAAFIMVNASLIALRRTRPSERRPFRTPGTLPIRGVKWVPILPVLGIASTLLLIANIDPSALLGGSIVLITGLVLAYAFRHHHAQAEAELAASPTNGEGDS